MLGHFAEVVVSWVVDLTASHPLKLDLLTRHIFCDVGSGFERNDTTASPTVHRGASSFFDLYDIAVYMIQMHLHILAQETTKASLADHEINQRYRLGCTLLIMIGSEYCTLQSLLRGISLIRQ